MPAWETRSVEKERDLEEKKRKIRLSKKEREKRAGKEEKRIKKGKKFISPEMICTFFYT